MVFRYDVFVVEDGDVSSYETVLDVSSAIDVGSFHDNAVLNLRVLYCACSSYLVIRVYVCIGGYLAVVLDYAWTPHLYLAVDFFSFSDSHIIRYRRS